MSEVHIMVSLSSHNKTWITLRENGHLTCKLTPRGNPAKHLKQK